jgi:hypothetical protein
MLLDREPLDSIAEALRIDQAELNRRVQRVVGRLRPQRAGRLEAGGIRAREAFGTR